MRHLDPEAPLVDPRVYSMRIGHAPLATHVRMTAKIAEGIGDGHLAAVAVAGVRVSPEPALRAARIIALNVQGIDALRRRRPPASLTQREWQMAEPHDVGSLPVPLDCARCSILFVCRRAVHCGQIVIEGLGPRGGSGKDVVERAKWRSPRHPRMGYVPRPKSPRAPESFAG